MAKLQPSGWARVLRGFIYSRDFDNIIVELAKQAKDGKRFTPTMKNWFRAFEECPYTDIKVVIIGQDPYPGLGHADGISFSLSQTAQMLTAAVGKATSGRENLLLAYQRLRG